MSQQQNQNWSSKTETVVHRWGLICQTYCNMHLESSIKYHTRKKWFELPVTLLGALTTASIFTTLQQESGIYEYFGMVFSVSFTLLHAVDKTLNYGKVMQKHRNAASAYDDITMEIEKCLSLPRNERIPAIEFMDRIKQEIKRLGKSSVNIDENTFSNYTKDLEKLESLPVNSINTHFHSRDESGSPSDYVIEILPKSKSNEKLGEVLNKLIQTPHSIIQHKDHDLSPIDEEEQEEKSI
jgi:hypothetical protein